jgi:hypothetical protein
MKKGLLLVVIVGAAAFVLYKFVFKKDDSKGPKAQPIAVAGSDSLTLSVGAALQGYYDLANGFVKSDTGLVNQSAGAFASKLEAVKMNEVKADSSLVELAVQLQQSISSEAKNIMSAAGLEAKRKSFQVMSDAFYDLLRTVRYSGGKVYQQYCPMAFDNAGAAWLSSTTDVVNPYFGDKMLHCGETRDSISIGK